MKGIRQHILDFEILETFNLKTLVFVDSSEYFEAPEKPLLEVTLPGHTKYFLTEIEASHVNTLNSNTLGLTRVFDSCYLINLPDGVYTFKFKICPYKYINRTKYILRTTTLLSQLHQVLDKLDLTDCSIQEDKKLQSELTEIFLLIESAKASAELGHVKKASDKYAIAHDKVSTLLEKIKTK